MPSPFPGMDPYLEGSAWMGVHTELSVEIARLGRDGPTARKGVHLGPEEQGQIGGDDGGRRAVGERVIREAF